MTIWKIKSLSAGEAAWLHKDLGINNFDVIPAETKDVWTTTGQMRTMVTCSQSIKFTSTTDEQDTLIVLKFGQRACKAGSDKWF